MAVLVGIVAAAVLFGVSFAGTGSDTPAASLSPAADVAFRLFDGSEATLADFRGTPIVLNFWASWCPACVAEMPSFQAVHEALGDQVVFLGLDVQDSRAAADAFVAQSGVQYLLGEDPQGTILQAFGGIAMPTTVFIDADGNVVGRQSGAIFEEDLTAQIEELFFNA